MAYNIVGDAYLSHRFINPFKGDNNMTDKEPTREEIRLRNEGEREALARIKTLIENGTTLEQIKEACDSMIKTIDHCEKMYDKYYKD